MCSGVVTFFFVLVDCCCYRRDAYHYQVHVVSGDNNNVEPYVLPLNLFPVVALCRRCTSVCLIFAAVNIKCIYHMMCRVNSILLAERPRQDRFEALYLHRIKCVPKCETKHFQKDPDDVGRWFERRSPHSGLARSVMGRYWFLKNGSGGGRALKGYYYKKNPTHYY